LIDETKAIDNAVTVCPGRLPQKKMNVEIKREVKEAKVEVYTFAEEKYPRRSPG
jgi:hypothetical protein